MFTVAALLILSNRSGVLTFSPDVEGGYYYDRLSPDEQKAYAKIVDKIEDMPPYVVINRCSGDSLKKIVEAIFYDCPQFFFFGENSTLTDAAVLCTFSTDYSMTADEYKEAKVEVEATAQKILSTLTQPDDAWQTELELHDYLVDHCKYTSSETSHATDIYGALVLGEANCQGYSLAMTYLMRLAGFECRVVTGTGTDINGKTESHMWNIVKIDGNYYQLDVTWDDPTPGTQKSHTFFNVTDDDVNYSHTGWESDDKCFSTEANYFARKNLLFGSFSSDEISAVADALAEEIAAGGDTVQFRLTSASVYEKASSRMFKNGGINTLINEVSARSGASGIRTDCCNYSVDKDLKIITISVEKR